MLEIEALNYRLGGVSVFKDLTLHVAVGEHAVIVGNSGSGKSTLLKLIAENDDSAIKMATNVASAMVLQEGALLDYLTPLENLSLVQRYNSTQPAPDPKAVLKSLNIDEALYNQPIATLSGGQKRRIAIARALMRKPELLLFDEPDAGLDVSNLSTLAAEVNKHSTGRSLLTVSHNPIYIAKVAHKVYRLIGGELVLIAEFSSLPTSPNELIERQNHLQEILERVSKNEIEPHSEKAPAKVPLKLKQGKASYPIIHLLQGAYLGARSLVKKPRSISDQLAVAGYVFYLSCITGLLFFALVGLMLGGTTIAVVKLLADNALTGFVGLFLSPDDLLEMMGGVYVLYLAPPIGGMLFAARSGSIVSSWLGQLEYSRKRQALSYLNVPTDLYLRVPAIWAMFFGMLLSSLWFAVAVWFGGVAATYNLFDVPAPTTLMALSSADIQLSSYLPKVFCYSAGVALVTVSMGMAKKDSAHCVNVHTTKAIIYSTLGIALTELLVILWH